MSNAPLRIAIVGAGGVGGLLGVLLAESGQGVGFVVRGENLRVLRESGLHVTSPGGELRLRAPEVTDRPSELGPADVVFLSTKTYDLARSALASAPMIRDHTIVVTLQNGVEAEAIVRRNLPGASVLPGVVYVASTRIAAGEIRQVSPFFRLAFGATDGREHPNAGWLESVCRKAGIEATHAKDMAVRLWTKFVFIASVSAVTCMRNLRVGPMRSDAGAFDSLARAMREVAAVGHAHGVALPGDVVDRALAVVASLPPEATPSMHEDLLAGRPLEIEFLSGAVVRLGRERGVATPIHVEAYERLRDRAAGAPKAP